jgi:hypothetical protein
MSSEVRLEFNSKGPLLFGPDLQLEASNCGKRTKFQSENVLFHEDG